MDRSKLEYLLLPIHSRTGTHSPSTALSPSDHSYRSIQAPASLHITAIIKLTTPSVGSEHRAALSHSAGQTQFSLSEHSMSVSRSSPFPPVFSHSSYYEHLTRIGYSVRESVGEDSVNQSVHVPVDSIFDVPVRELSDLSSLSAPAPSSSSHTASSLLPAAVVEALIAQSAPQNEEKLPAAQEERLQAVQNDVGERPLSEAAQAQVRKIAVQLALLDVLAYMVDSNDLFMEYRVDPAYWEMWTTQRWRSRSRAVVNINVESAVDLQHLMTEAGLDSAATVLKRVIASTPEEWRGRELWGTELAAQLFAGERKVEDWHKLRVMQEGWLWRPERVAQLQHRGIQW